MCEDLGYKDEYLMHKYPASLPPNMTPKKSHGIKITSGNQIKRIVYTVNYIWLKDNFSYWMYPLTFTNEQISVYIWKDDRWILSNIHRDMILAYY